MLFTWLLLLLGLCFMVSFHIFIFTYKLFNLYEHFSKASSCLWMNEVFCFFPDTTKSYRHRNIGRQLKSGIIWKIQMGALSHTFSLCSCNFVCSSVYLPPCCTNTQERVELFCAFLRGHINQIFASPCIHLSITI